MLDLGYAVLARNYRSQEGEIDLIVTRNEIVVFVEVKNRKKVADFNSALTEKQYSRARQTAEHFLAQCNQHYLETRFDAIFVTQGSIVEHITNIW